MSAQPPIPSYQPSIYTSVNEFPVANRIESEFSRLIANAGYKRELLITIAGKQVQHRKTLTIIAGVLALLSAATVTSVLSDFTPAPTMKIIAAVLSTVSGFISILSSLGFKESEIFKLYTGASDYLGLRERANRFIIDPQNMDEKQRFKKLGELQDLYADLDKKYQRYMPTGRLGTGPASDKPRF